MFVSESTSPAVAMMTEPEARLHVQWINQSLSEAGAYLLELHDREGWRALGYTSWGECAAAEFQVSRATVYRYLRLAQTEQVMLEAGATARPTMEQTRALQPLLIEQGPAAVNEVWADLQSEYGTLPVPVKAVHAKIQPRLGATPSMYLKEVRHELTPRLSADSPADVSVLRQQWGAAKTAITRLVLARPEQMGAALSRREVPVALEHLEHLAEWMVVFNRTLEERHDRSRTE